MNELDCQKLIVDAVVNGGYGRAMKYKDAFLAGPADLLIKLHDQPALWLEAKLKKLSPRTTDLNWELDVTRLQRNFLKDWRAAGMWTGVVSFIHDTGGNVGSLKMVIYSYLDLVDRGWYATLTDHQPLGDHRSRNDNIMKQLRNF